MFIPSLSAWNKGDYAYWCTVDGVELKLQNYGIGRNRWGASVTYPNGTVSYAYRSETFGPTLIGGGAADAYTYASEPTPGKARELLAKAWTRVSGKKATPRKNPDSWMVVREKGKVIDAGAYSSTRGPFASKKKAKAVAKKEGGHLRGRRADSLSRYHGRGHPDVAAHFRGVPERKAPPSQNVIVDEVNVHGKRTGVTKRFRTKEAAERFSDDSYTFDFDFGTGRNYHRFVLRTKPLLPNPKRNPAKHVYEPTFERKLPSYLGGGTVREGLGRYLGEGIHWTEAKGKAALRRERAEAKAAGETALVKSYRLDKRPAHEAERLQKVLRAATSGPFTLWSSGQGTTQVEGRFATRKRAEAVARVLSRVYPGVHTWVEGRGSVAAKLRRMDEEDGLR